MRHNQLAQAYKMLSEVECEQQKHARWCNLPISPSKYGFISK